MIAPSRRAARRAACELEKIDEVFVAVPFPVPPARHDDEGGEEHEEDQASPQDDRESQGGKLFDDGFRHG